ncbi:MAG: metalloregulator ArsR/SmtB family transcription factor [Bacillota bacterium]
MEEKKCCCDLTMARQLIADEAMCGRMANLFKALSEPTRVKLLLSMLHGEVCVQGFVDLLGLTQPSISNQLSKLKSDGLVKCRKEKNNIYYSLDDEHVHDLVEIGLKHINHI